jgi:hypothetical protein
MRMQDGIGKKCRCDRSAWSTTCRHSWYVIINDGGERKERSLRKLAKERGLRDPRTHQDAQGFALDFRGESMTSDFARRYNQRPQSLPMEPKPTLEPKPFDFSARSELHRMTSSQGAYESALAKRRTMPTIVQGVVQKGELLIQPQKLREIGIDERYQRMRITQKVNSLVVVIKSDGLIPDPVSLMRRADSSLWIVDGQQRYWAHYDTDTPMLARVYEVDPEHTAMALDIERRLFTALNNTRVQSSGTTIKAHVGLSAEILRRQNADTGSTLYDRIQFESRGPSRKNPIIAGSLVRGMLLAAAAVRPAGSLIERVLPRLDLELAKPEGRCRAEGYLRLVGLVFTPLTEGKHSPSSLAIKALGSVCFKKWETSAIRGAAVLPDFRAVNRLRRVNWRGIADSNAERFLPVYEEAILKIWKKK